jgi:hypothetical protein
VGRWNVWVERSRNVRWAEFIAPAGEPLLNHLFSVLEDRVTGVIATSRADAIKNLMHSGFAKQ